MDFAAAVVSREPAPGNANALERSAGSARRTHERESDFLAVGAQNSPKDLEFRRADRAKLIPTPPKTSFYFLFTGRGKGGVTKGVETATGILGQ